MTRLRLYRLLRELTQDALAEAVGKSQPQILRYERGDAPIPPALLARFARVLNVPEDALNGTGSFDVIALSKSSTDNSTEEAVNG